jgi:ketosteroid isomerase-like protein
MDYEQAQANMQLILDWIDALCRGDIDAIAERFHPDVAWVDVAGGLACTTSGADARIAVRRGSGHRS